MPILRRKKGTESFVQLMDQVPGLRLYRRVRFDADMPMAADEAEHHRREGMLPDGEAMLSISGIHAFTGGVTHQWLVERVREWDAALAEQRRKVKQAVNRTPLHPAASDTVH